MPRPERPKSLILISPSRFGKTQWARALGDHIYWNNLVNLDDWNDNASYCIFDDFSWDFIPCKKGFLGAQETFVLTDKYRKKRTVSWGKPCIVLCNDFPVISDPNFADWLQANTISIVLSNKLY